ncbi:hypothetical protein H3H37_15960 [Duganella sp. LX20W]|uniref:HEPN AbiU2-like domain-containing protein n=1 Tax=Rugamonas brunnea TaxID=2758569 RepID=A0A7W2EU10_9BURK|nr:hypothetical protein [Rugamonas brunnea]MBA5638555.1 hypothetical protein [Rugamonas brunnea]
MTKQEEAYVHFVGCMENLNRAWMLTQLIRKNAAAEPLITAAYELALIEYAKSFKPSEGIHSRKYIWQEPSLSKEQLELHRKIIKLRDKVLAHSDISVKEAQLYVSESGGSPIMTVVSNMPEQLPLPEEVSALIEQLLREKYAELEALDHAMVAATAQQGTLTDAAAEPKY